MTSNGKLYEYIKTKVFVAADQVAADAAQEMRANAPVDTGRLRDSITHRVNSDGHNVTLVFEASAPHAIYVEYGNSNPNYPSQPFMRPVIDRLQNDIEDLLKGKI